MASNQLDPLRSHHSRLPTFLYPLSFSPPCPSPFRHPVAFLRHPFCLYTIGTISALSAGACLPASGIVYGWWTNGVTGSGTSEGRLDRSKEAGWIMTLIGVAAFFLSWAFLFCFSTASDILTTNLRRAYVSAVLIQDQNFYDTHGPGEIASRAGKDINTIRTACGEKIGFVMWSIGTLIASIIPSFILAARLSGVIIAIIPFTLAIILFSSYLIHTSSAPISSLEGRSSSLIEQILSSVRIAQTFSMESFLIKRLDEHFLARLEGMGKVRAVARAFEQAGVYFALFLCFSLSFWFSGVEVVRGVQVGYALTCFWNMINALFALANVLPHISSLADAGVALQTLRRQIERKPFIDVRDPSGLILPSTNNTQEDESSGQGREKIEADWTAGFEMQNITFAYPSRPTVKSLDDVSLAIEPGKMTAFVGHSGSGKSTTVALLLREYDPETANMRNPADEDVEVAPGIREGDSDDLIASQSHGTDDDDENKNKKGIRQIMGMKGKAEDEEKARGREALDRARVKGSGRVLFAGRDVRDYNLRWYRKQIAVVSQAPQLFSCSIFENVASGLTGTEFEYIADRDSSETADEATKERTRIIRDLVEDALRKAQAWDFVTKLPEGMDTVITGGRAQLLSGGQRQRVALARALVRKPAVLLLDEATSALDSASEEKVRQMLAIEQKERGMTLIVVAHRLSTILGADKVYVMASGKVVDEGTYDELLQPDRKDHTFRDMVMANQEQQQADTESGQALSEKANFKLENGRSRSSSTSRTIAVDAGTETPPVKPNEHSSQIKSKRPDPHMLYSGRGSTYGRMDHNVEAPHTLAGTTDATHPDVIAHTGSSFSVNEKEVAVSHDRPDPLKPKHYGKAALLRNYGTVMKDRKWFFAAGILASIAAGAGWPLEGWMVGEAVDVLQIEGDNNAVRSGANKWALWFLVLAIADFAVLLFNGISFELTSERVVRNLKRDGMAALLRQEVGFFESSEETDAGALTSAITSNPADITSATGLVLSQIIVAITNLLGSTILGFTLSWKITVVALPPILVTFFSGWLNVAMLDKYESKNSGPAARCASFLSETVDVIRTVTNLGYQRSSMRSFEKHNVIAQRSAFFLNLGSIGFSISQSMIILLQALLFYWGGRLVSQNELSIVALYASFEAIIIASFASSRLLLFVGDVGRAFTAMAIVKSWYDRKPLVAKTVQDASVTEKMTHGREIGDIVISHVELRYPRRPEHPALKDVSLTIQSGKTHAFCGSSGSGKSSLVALLLRFYEPCKGTVTFGGHDSRSIPLEELRSKCAYVSQDPQLFEGSIRWNLSLGAIDSESVTQAQLEKACEQANILDFIRGLKHGFDTEIGMKGSQLSGGQRQRLCIARALVRQPEILFLDEATSALDAVSERECSKALASASVGRTTITIAHRLSTIRKADMIHVIENGSVREEGTHEELLAKKGRYVELVKAQL